MAAFIVPPPAPFVINDDKVEDRFVDYKNKFLTFMRANGLDSKEEGQKIAIFKSFCGEDLCDQIEADECEDDTLNDVLQRLHHHYLPASNTLQEQFNFFIRRQRPSENFDKYLIELKKIAKNCNFGELEDNLLKVVLIMNMKDITEQQKILKDADNKKLDVLVPDFRKFDAIKKTQAGKKTGTNKNPPPKQNQQPQPSKQNQPQAQKQNAPPPPKPYQPPKEKQKQTQPQKQNPPKQKQPESVKKESTKNSNPQGNGGTKEKKGNPFAGEKKKSKPQNGDNSTSIALQFADDLLERVKKLST